MERWASLGSGCAVWRCWNWTLTHHPMSVPHESRASRDCEVGGAWQLCHHLQGQSFGFEDANSFSFCRRLSHTLIRVPSALIRISCHSIYLCDRVNLALNHPCQSGPPRPFCNMPNVPPRRLTTVGSWDASKTMSHLLASLRLPPGKLAQKWGNTRNLSIYVSMSNRDGSSANELTSITASTSAPITVFTSS